MQQQSPFDDINPSAGRRSIRNIEISPDTRNPRATRASGSQQIPRATKPKIGKKIKVLIAASVLIGIIFFSFVTLTGGTSISVTVSTTPAALDSNIIYTAYTDPKETDLGFQVITREYEENETLTASGTDYVEEKAVGTIRIFNDFNSAKQRLITNTRFESPTGKIYRIREPVTVPGQSTVAGKTTPGSIEATVYADDSGESYNTASNTRFTIPGLKGGDRYDSFYAIAVDAIAGGFSGERPIVDESELAAAQKRIRDKLLEEAYSRIQAEVPESFFLPENMIFTSFASAPTTITGGSATVGEKMIVRALMFDRFALSNTLAQTTGKTEGSVLVEDFETITFAVLNKENAEPWSDGLIQFTVTGESTFIGTVDTESLIADLVGKHRDAVPTIMGGYPTIVKADVFIRPFWKKTFPESSADIEVTILK